MTSPEQPKDKTKFAFAWITQVAQDRDLLPGTQRLASLIAQHLWAHKELEGRYVLNKSQKFFETELGASRSSIQSWFNDLVRHGHLDALVHKGKGRMNEYMPAMDPISRAVAAPVPKAEQTRAAPTGETMPPVDTDVVKPADPLHLPDDGETAILHEMPMAEVEAIVARLADDIAWLRTNVHRPPVEIGDPRYPEFVAFVDEWDSRAGRLGELVAVLRAAFPPRPGPGLSKGIQDFLVNLITGGDDAVEIIRDAREYVRVTEAAGGTPKGPFKWIQERVLVDSQAHRARVAAGS